jgi:hypothetical protein
MPSQKMIPPLPDTLGASENDRFKRFAKAILAVPKTEVETQAIARLEAEKRKIEKKIVAVKRERAKRKSADQK